MIKLYKKINNELHYWEAWENDKDDAIVHWGIVGQEGETKVIQSSFLTSFKNKLDKLIKKCVLEGYKEIDLESHFILMVEYKVDGMGTDGDNAKRHALQDKLQEILGWTGLGHCDGGSIGSGTMESCCYVVDFDIAQKVIIERLKNTIFQDYSRIFQE